MSTLLRTRIVFLVALAAAQFPLLDLPVPWKPALGLPVEETFRVAFTLISLAGLFAPRTGAALLLGGVVLFWLAVLGSDRLYFPLLYLASLREKTLAGAAEFLSSGSIKVETPGLVPGPGEPLWTRVADLHLFAPAFFLLAGLAAGLSLWLLRPRRTAALGLTMGLASLALCSLLARPHPPASWAALREHRAFVAVSAYHRQRIEEAVSLLCPERRKECLSGFDFFPELLLASVANPEDEDALRYVDCVDVKRLFPFGREKPLWQRLLLARPEVRFREPVLASFAYALEGQALLKEDLVRQVLGRAEGTVMLNRSRLAFRRSFFLTPFGNTYGFSQLAGP